MRRTHKALATLALGLALAGATTTAWAFPPTGTQDQADQRKALYQSELERNLTHDRAAPIEDQNDRLLRNLQATQTERTQAAVAQARSMERDLTPVPAADRAATRPAAQNDPAAPSPGVAMLATVLIGLVGGLVGGAAALLGWTATTRQRRPRAAAGT